MTEEQELALKALGREAALDLCRIIVNNSDELVELAIHRAQNIGVKEYGDTTYHKDITEVRGELFDELADAIFYRHIILLRYQQAKENIKP